MGLNEAGQDQRGGLSERVFSSAAQRRRVACANSSSNGNPSCRRGSAVTLNGALASMFDASHPVIATKSIKHTLCHLRCEKR